MTNVEAAIILIVSEAERRHREIGGDLVGKIVEVSNEVTEGLMDEEKRIRACQREEGR